MPSQPNSDDDDIAGAMLLRRSLNNSSLPPIPVAMYPDKAKKLGAMLRKPGQ